MATSWNKETKRKTAGRPKSHGRQWVVPFARHCGAGPRRQDHSLMEDGKQHGLKSNTSVDVLEFRWDAISRRKVFFTLLCSTTLSYVGSLRHWRRKCFGLPFFRPKVHIWRSIARAPAKEALCFWSLARHVLSSPEHIWNSRWELKHGDQHMAMGNKRDFNVKCYHA